MHRPAKRPRLDADLPPEDQLPSKAGRVDHPYRLREPTSRFQSTANLLALRSTEQDPHLDRALWSRYQPWQKDLFDNPLWNERRGVYECPSCGTYATKQQVRNWYHPGSKYYTYPEAYRMTPGTPYIHDLFEEETANMESEEFRVAYENKIKGSDVYFFNRGFPTEIPHRIRIPAINHGSPPILACSEACYQTQALHNDRRNDLWKWLNKPKKSMMPAYTPRGAEQHAQIYPNMKTYEPVPDIFQES